MMLRLPPLLRTLALAFAIVQLAVPGVAAVADARAQADSRWTVGGHVEEHPSESCPHRHPASCALCQYLAFGSRPEAPPPVPVAPAERAMGSATSVVPAARGPAPTARPRAPPAV